MLSLRLPDDQEQKVTALARLAGMSRSAWLRRAIEREFAQASQDLNPHQVYLALMQAHDTQRDNQAAPDSAGMTSNGRNHSAVLKHKLRAKRDDVRHP